MKTIHHLPESLIRQIAAGEVISEPFSIVKEAIENSLDAEADFIEIEIKNGGISLLKVSDNGHGMSQEDLAIATDRHSTSKIKTENDLENLETLGFRGEFLASLVAVAEVDILTCAKGSSIAFQAKFFSKYSTGNSPTISQGSRTQGTTLLVKNLFENIPARKKFLPTSRQNISRIHEIIRQFSLGFPSCRFVFRSDGKELYRNQPGTIMNALLHVIGRNSCKNLIKLSTQSENGIWKLYDSYISIPSEYRSNRMSQYVFINNRIIENKIISQAIEKGYERFIASKKHPIVVLKLYTKPSEYDANVHPAKKEVRLQDSAFVFNFIKTSIETCLLQLNPSSFVKNPAFVKQSIVNNHLATNNDLDRDYPYSNTSATANQIQDDFIIEETNHYDENINVQRENNLFRRSEEKSELFKTSQFQHVVSKNEIVTLEIITQFNYKYILAKSYNFPGDLFIIDQHAVAERILLETLQNQSIRAHSQKVKQNLLDPIHLEINPIEEEILSTSLSLLNKMGYNIHLESNYIIKLKAYPIFFGRKTPKHAIIYNLRQIIDDLQNAGPNSLIKAVSEIEIAKSIACRNSIKAGDRLSREEMVELLNKMKKAEYPWVCCHGRPTIFKVQEKILDKLFWRN